MVRHSRSNRSRLCCRKARLEHGLSQQELVVLDVYRAPSFVVDREGDVIAADGRWAA